MWQTNLIASEQFAAWEERGRGYKVWPYPVVPEPPFRPFLGIRWPEPNPEVDDGRKPGLFASFFDSIQRALNPRTPVIPEREEEEPEPEELERDALLELQVILPDRFDVKSDVFAAFAQQLSLCNDPVAFEILGASEHVTIQFVASPSETPLVQRQLHAFFPEAVLQSREGVLAKAWDSCSGDDVLVVEFGLERPFMLPLAASKLDPFVGIIGALSGLRADEVCLFQVLFQSAESPWKESIINSVTTADGKPLFVNWPELVDAAEMKTARPLWATVVRLAIRSAAPERTTQIARDVAASLSVFSDPEGNSLIPLTNDEYPFEDHVEDVLRRQTRRSGMLLNLDELVGFIHLPSSAVSSPSLLRAIGRTKVAPVATRQSTGVLLGNNEHLGESIPVRLTAEQRLRHCHILGASGTGKSTLLFNLIEQDIRKGEGIAVLDPHGDLIERILGAIPEQRIQDVILLDPADEEYSVGFNILSAHSDIEKNLLASDLVSVFQRLSTSWGDQMGSVLQNAILAFLERSEGGTLADLRRFLIEPAYRDKVLETVRDPDIVYYWRKAFPQLTGNRSIGPVLTRLDTFLSPKPIRYMVSQPVNRLDFREILDSGKIFLAKLSQGQIGKENSYLLGSLLLAKFQQLVMGRQAQRAESRRPFFLYADEFHNFITPSLAEILSGARKYGLGLILAHQELHQLERNQEVKSAVLSNPYVRVVFRVGDSDARALESGFSFFEAKDFQNLETGRAICRIEKADADFNLSVPPSVKVPEEQAEAIRRKVVAASQSKYATGRAEIEAALSKLNRNLEPGQPKKVVPKFAHEPASEAVEATGSGEKEVAAVSPVPLVPVEKTVEPITNVAEQPCDLGRGGEQHKSIQERLQKEAHALGFLAEIEKQLKDNCNDAADLLLTKGDVLIAVEITVTTTIDHEFGNIKKCLEAGLSRVAMVSSSPERLKQIAVAVQAGLGAEAAAKVGYYSPDDFIEFLRALAPKIQPKVEAPAAPKEKVTRGFKVRRHGPQLTPEERKAKEQAMQQILSDVMKPKPKTEQ